MFDQILPRLAPDAKYTFATISEMRLSRLPGDDKPIEREEQIPIYDDYDAIVWTDLVIKQPTLAVCETEWLVIQRENSNEGIDEKRIAEYGGIGDQLDMLYWDSINGTTEWVDHITQVKADNPKL